MDLKEFRILHSELIEHYQFIEYHLECIYAAFQEGESFVDNLKIVDKDSILNLVERILLLQKKTKRIVLSEEVCKKIRMICSRRNFWCHNCYVDSTFDFKSKGLKYKKDIEEMMKDLSESRQLRECLFDLYIQYFPPKGNKVKQKTQDGTIVGAVVWLNDAPANKKEYHKKSQKNSKK